MGKILIFTPSFFPRVGGVEKHIAETSRLLVQKGWAITVITELFPETSPKEEKDGIRIFRFSYPRVRFWGLLLLWWQILVQYFAEIRRADVIHIHDVFIWYLPFRFLFPFKRVITTVHGWEGTFPIPKRNTFIRKLGAVLSTRTVAVGDYLEKYYDFSADTIIYGGVTVPLKKTAKENLLLYVGRLDYDTGLPLLLQALHMKPWPGKVIFCGDGILREQAEIFGEVMGFQDPTPFLKKAKIVFAGGYLSILEAFAHHCAVIAAYENPLKKDYFLLAPFGHFMYTVTSISEVQRKLEFLQKNTQTQEKNIQKAFEWVQSQSWKKVAELYDQLYRN